LDVCAWAVAAGLGLLWPSHIASTFDGAPLDQPLEAILIGLVFPLLVACDVTFLRRRFAKVAIVVLLVSRGLSVFFTQEGWCIRFEPMRPYVIGQTGRPHAWDVRADWRSSNPLCSAIETRSYHSLAEFPVWFFNLPPAGEGFPVTADRPPGAVTRMVVTGFLHATDGGTLQIERTPDVQGAMSVDGSPDVEMAAVGRGTHFIIFDGLLKGADWRFVPTWNGQDVWKQVLTTTRRPHRIDMVYRDAVRMATTAAVICLFAGWIGSVITAVLDAAVLAWTIAAAVAIGWLLIGGHGDAGRWAILALIAATAVRLRGASRTLKTAVCMIGVPWLVFVSVPAWAAVGRVTLYEAGNDFWTFQRYAYRIVMQGFWLEGGSATFWFQPLYRWIAGVLHMAFGDSSVGERLWDGGCLLTGALFSFKFANRFAGFRGGLIAAVLPLAVFVLGTPQYLMGRGLSEISSAGFIYLAAIFALDSERRLAAAFAAGLLASLGFYTRLNNLAQAVGVAAFAIPIDVPTSALATSRAWWLRVSWRSIAVIFSNLTLAAVFLAWRTWHFTGVFSVFFGTQRDHLALWSAGMPWHVAVQRSAESIWMVLSVNDPPRLDPYALPVVGGAIVCVLAVVAVPRLRDVPLSLVLFFFTSIAGAIVARGSAYAGRFSVHVLPATTAALVCGVVALCRGTRSPARGRLESAERRSSSASLIAQS
jgi:hypothetical protein